MLPTAPVHEKDGSGAIRQAVAAHLTLAQPQPKVRLEPVAVPMEPLLATTEASPFHLVPPPAVVSEAQPIIIPTQRPVTPFPNLPQTVLPAPTPHPIDPVVPGNPEPNTAPQEAPAMVPTVPVPGNDSRER